MSTPCGATEPTTATFIGRVAPVRATPEFARVGCSSSTPGSWSTRGDGEPSSKGLKRTRPGFAPVPRRLTLLVGGPFRRADASKHGFLHAGSVQLDGQRDRDRRREDVSRELEVGWSSTAQQEGWAS